MLPDVLSGTVHAGDEGGELAKKSCPDQERISSFPENIAKGAQSVLCGQPFCAGQPCQERCAAMRLPIRWRSGGDLPWLAKLGNLLADAPMPTAYRPVGRGITREKFKSRALLALKQFLGEAWLKA